MKGIAIGWVKSLETESLYDAEWLEYNGLNEKWETVTVDFLC